MPFSRNSADASFETLSRKLSKTAARYQPWIGDFLANLCAEYDAVVKNSVGEQTVAGSHDVDEIQKLERRTVELRAAVAKPRSVKSAPKRS